jgi:predicted TIM-barrel fold metal-dependent hydrolase
MRHLTRSSGPRLTGAEGLGARIGFAGWAEEYLGLKSLKEPPGHYVRQNIYFSVQYERVAIEQRHNVGVDHIMFATDFPHIENEWPNSRRVIDKIYPDIAEDDKRKIWAGNAVEFFHLAN